MKGLYNLEYTLSQGVFKLLIMPFITEDAHLHFELWVDGHYLGQFLRPIEVRELVEELFGQ